MGLKTLRRVTVAALLAGNVVNATTSSDDSTTSTTPSPTNMMPEEVTASPTSMMMMPDEMTTFNGTDTPSPNTPIPKPECDITGTQVMVRYSATTGRLYLESNTTMRGGCVTLDQIWEARGGGAKGGAKPPLFAIDPATGAYSENITGTWLLEEDLYVTDGITLKVWGSASGGVADELRLKSAPATDGENATVINLRAHGGSLDFENTKVFGWDTVNNDYDMDETDGRSYISAVSEVLTEATSSNDTTTDSSATYETCEGNAKDNMGEARMDIVNSEIGYLGYQDAESYGLTWKVRGFCKDKSNPEIFDEVNVYGNIYDSELHHMRFAVYTYGHQQGDWRRNTVHSNSGYGYDPHDDSDYLTIHDNTVYDNGYHGIIASKRCNNVSIQNNTVFGGNTTSAGIFLHRSSDYAIVKNNHCYNNGDAGMAMLESSNADISGNVFENNKYGIRMSVGCTNNTFHDNSIYNTSNYALYTYLGSDAPDVQPSGRSQDNVFDSNFVFGGPQAIKFKESDGNILTNNTFTDPGVIEFNSSYGNVVRGNIGLEDATEVKLRRPTCFLENDEAVLDGSSQVGDDSGGDDGDDDGSDNEDVCDL